MSGADFRQLTNLVAGIETFLYAVCMAAFFYSFMTGKKEQRKRRLKKVFLVFLAYAVTHFIKMGIYTCEWMRMAIVLVLLVAVSKFLDMDRGFTFFLGAIFFCIRNLSALMMRNISYFFSKYFEQEVEAAECLENIFHAAAWGHIFTEILQMLLFFVMLYAIRRLIMKRTSKLHRKELCYLLFIPAAGILFGSIIFNILSIMNENLVFPFYERFPVFLGIVPIVASLFYMGIYITIASYQKMIALQEEKEKYFVEQQQVHAMRERMEEVEEFYNGIRQMKHEMKNHLTNIKGLAKSGKYGEMEKYIGKMDESMNAFAITVKTGNVVTDVIVTDQQKAASNQGISFQSEFSYPASDGYNAYDIGIIINNLLQNAMEACGKMQEGKKYIYLSGRQKKKFFLIHVENSFEGKVVFDTRTEFPISTKGKEDSLHGIGLSNVKREVDKYMGDMDIKVKKNEFSVTVLLQERRKK